MLLEKCEFVGNDGVQCNQAARIGGWYCVIHEPREPRRGTKLSSADKVSLANSGTRIAVAVWELVRDEVLTEAKARRILRQFWSEVGYAFKEAKRPRSRPTGPRGVSGRTPLARKPTPVAKQSAAKTRKPGTKAQPKLKARSKTANAPVKQPARKRK
jgi:hypothetical protein